MLLVSVSVCYSMTMRCSGWKITSPPARLKLTHRLRRTTTPC
nr:MAG TPA: hypothetical protein [Caudoviricetes sp.]